MTVLSGSISPQMGGAIRVPIDTSITNQFWLLLGFRMLLFKYQLSKSVAPRI